MRFAPDAVVYHTHPATLSGYLRKKYKFAFWRVLAIRKNPAKGIQDSHTPQVMKLQLLFGPTLVASLAFDVLRYPKFPLSGIVCAAFLISTLPFAFRALSKDPLAAVLSPLLLVARACAQLLGVTAGLVNASRKPAQVAAGSPVRN